MLMYVWENLNYQEIAHICSIQPETAKRHVTKARQHFAEMHHLPLETLHLDERWQRKPRLADEERRLLNDYFVQKFGGRNAALILPDSTRQSGELESSTSDEQNTRRGWAQDVEQARHSPPKRQR